MGWFSVCLKFSLNLDPRASRLPAGWCLSWLLKGITAPLFRDAGHGLCWQEHLKQEQTPCVRGHLLSLGYHQHLVCLQACDLWNKVGCVAVQGENHLSRALPPSLIASHHLLL